MPHVPDYEPHRHTPLRTPGLTGCRRVAPEACTQLPYGAVLADILRRTWGTQFLQAVREEGREGVTVNE